MYCTRVGIVVRLIYTQLIHNNVENMKRHAPASGFECLVLTYKVAFAFLSPRRRICLYKKKGGSLRGNWTAAIYTRKVPSWFPSEIANTRTRLSWSGFVCLSVLAWCSNKSYFCSYSSTDMVKELKVYLEGSERCQKLGLTSSSIAGRHVNGHYNGSEGLFTLLSPDFCYAHARTRTHTEPHMYQ